MKNNTQKETKSQPTPLTSEQLESVKGGTETATANTVVVVEDIVL